jgi:hypothetical protein
MHMIVDAGVIDLCLHHLHAEGSGRAHGLGALAGGKQRLRRHAAIVEAVAAHAAFFDEHDRHAELRRGGGHREAPGSCADHAEIGLELLLQFRHRSPPIPLGCLALEALHGNRDQRHDPERHKPSEQSWRQQGPGLEHVRT